MWSPLSDNNSMNIFNQSMSPSSTLSQNLHGTIGSPSHLVQHFRSNDSGTLSQSIYSPESVSMSIDTDKCDTKVDFDVWSKQSSDTAMDDIFHMLSITKPTESTENARSGNLLSPGAQSMSSDEIMNPKHSEIMTNNPLCKQDIIATRGLRATATAFECKSSYQNDICLQHYSPSRQIPVSIPNSIDFSCNRSMSPRQSRCIKIASDYSQQLLKSLVCSTKNHSKDKIRPRFDEAVDGYIYIVRFKRAHKNYVLSPTAPKNVLPGMFVKVEADRGEDLGIVLAKIPIQRFEEEVPTAGYRGRGFSSGQGERKYILRQASNTEKLMIPEKVEEEEKVLQAIREKIIQRKLPMVVLDAEFQFDRHKLTYFFEAERRIDFRELVSELFSLYKTRIWMQQVDTSTIPGSNDPEVQLAHTSGLLPINSMMSSLQGYHRTPSLVSLANIGSSIDSTTYLSSVALENISHVDSIYRSSSSSANATGIRNSLTPLFDNSWCYLNK